MKNKLILCTSIFMLAACSSGTYVTDVTTESYREDFNANKVEPPMFSSNSVEQSSSQTSTSEFKIIAPPQVVKPVKIIPPTAKQVKAVSRFGYTIQVAAVPNETKVIQFAAKLPQQVQPIWQNYKEVKGTRWYTVLYGDFATAAEAQDNIKSLSSELRSLKPFVKSIDAIKNSNYPNLKKLN